MTTIEQAKKDLVETLNAVNKDKLSLPDLRLYAEILKTVSEIQEKSYAESMAEMLGSGFALGGRSATVSELK